MGRQNLLINVFNYKLNQTSLFPRNMSVRTSSGGGGGGGGGGGQVGFGSEPHELADDTRM